MPGSRQRQLLEQANVEAARRRLIATGNPLPLIRQQWPDVVLDGFQKDILTSMFSPSIRELYAKGCTSSGKTSATALGICAYFYAYDSAKVVLTSTSSKHVESVLFAEVVRWFNAMRLRPTRAEVLASGIRCDKQHYIECVNPGAGEGFSGRHGDRVLFVFDEASGVPDDRFRLANTQANSFVALANPRTLSGAFRGAFSLADDPDRTQTVLGPYGRRRLLTIGGSDCLNVRSHCLEHPVGPIGGIRIARTTYGQGEPIPPEVYETVRPKIPGQLCYDTFKAHASNPDQRWADCFAHGRFATEDPELQVILGSWLKRHVDAWTAAKPEVTCFGLDPAASEHGDETVLAAGGESGCRALHTSQRASLMDTCGWVISTARSHYGIELAKGQHEIVVDADGLGKGVADRLRELGCRVTQFRGNESAADNKRHANRRAEAYDALAARLDPAGKHAGTPWALPSDELLAQDLTAPERIYSSDGFRFRISPKVRKSGMPEHVRTLSEKLGRSPDRGDAVVYLHWAAARPRKRLRYAAPVPVASATTTAAPGRCSTPGCHMYTPPGRATCCDACDAGKGHTVECCAYARQRSLTAPEPPDTLPTPWDRAIRIA